MLEDAGRSLGVPGASDDGGVVELVADNEAALLDEGGDVGRVGGKAHGRHDGGRLAHIAGHQRLHLEVKVLSTDVSSGTRGGHTVLLDGNLSRIGTGSLALGESEVVVGSEVEAGGASAGEPEGRIVVVRLAIEEGDLPAWNSSDRPVPAIANALVEVP